MDWRNAHNSSINRPQASMSQPEAVAGLAVERSVFIQKQAAGRG